MFHSCEQNFFTYLILMFSFSLLQVPIVGDTTMAKMCSARPGGPLLTVLVENLKFIVSTMIIVVLSIWGEYMWEGVTFWYPKRGCALYIHIRY